MNQDDIIVRIQEEPIDVGALITKMKSTSAGALSIFLGTTRDNFENKKVLKLFYEAHPTMALKKMKDIADYCLKTFNLLKILIIHRTGEVPVTEESIVIIATSAHRKESLDAISYCIDEVKKVVPIWKKEIFEDGNNIWKENIDSIHLNN